MTRYTLVTGTDTGVGKTVATAAVAAHLASRGLRVAVVKPIQTGLAAGEPGDADEVRRLTGLSEVHELVRLAEPLAPESAALVSGQTLPTVDTLARRTVEVAGDAEAVLVEGAGGVAVRLDRDGRTLLDLARALEWHTSADSTVDVLLVVRAALGTLNHTALSLDAIRRAGLDVRGLVVGSWPDEPGLAERTNVVDLPRTTGVALFATLPAGAAALTRAAFVPAAAAWCADPT